MINESESDSVAEGDIDLVEVIENLTVADLLDADDELGFNEAVEALEGGLQATDHVKAGLVASLQDFIAMLPIGIMPAMLRIARGEVPMPQGPPWHR